VYCQVDFVNSGWDLAYGEFIRFLFHFRSVHPQLVSRCDEGIRHGTAKKRPKFDAVAHVFKLNHDPDLHDGATADHLGKFSFKLWIVSAKIKFVWDD